MSNPAAPFPTTSPYVAGAPTATPYLSLIQQARFRMNAAKGNPNDSTYDPDMFWSDDELFSYAKQATTDLWGAMIDLHQEHFLTINESDVSLPTNSTALAGVPRDVFRIYMIEPLDPTTNACAFVPRPYNHVEFVNARQQAVTTSFSPTSGVNIFYCLAGVGAPSATPMVLCAPEVTTAVPVRFSYIPVLGIQSYTLQTTNPIPGESDNAIVSWIMAYARIKDRDDKSPDPAHLAVYGTEKQGILTRCIPRQEQDALYADGMFDDYWR